MKPLSLSPSFRGIACSLSLLVATPASAQPDSLKSIVEEGLAAMNAGDWPRAHSLNVQAIQRFGNHHPLDTFGPQFGAIHYRKGLCEMKLSRWLDAMLSFEVCYRDFPNSPNYSSSTNPFQKLALLKWGEAAMGAQKWQIALAKFEKFHQERDRAADVFPLGLHHVHASICHAKLGQVPMAIEHLEIALKNRSTFDTPEPGILAALEALATSAILGKNEQALLDCLQKNRGELTLSHALMHRHSRVFLKLAGDATTSGMLRAALALYSFVPDSALALEDALATPTLLTPAELSELQSDIASPDSPARIKLSATALLHQKLGNTRGTLAAQQRLQHLQTPPPLLTPPTAPTPWPPSTALQAAIDLFEGRKYPEAKLAFAALLAEETSSPPTSPAQTALCRYYHLECLRKMNDLAALSTAAQNLDRTHLTRTSQRLQCEIHTLCTLAHHQKWQDLHAQATLLSHQPLPTPLQAQLAYYHGLALEALQRIPAAISAYQTALIADAAASEDIARLATLRLLAIHLADPDVHATLSHSGTPLAQDATQGTRDLAEAGALARLFQLSFGNGTPLPPPYQDFLAHAPID